MLNLARKISRQLDVIVPECMKMKCLLKLTKDVD